MKNIEFYCLKISGSTETSISHDFKGRGIITLHFHDFEKYQKLAETSAETEILIFPVQWEISLLFPILVQTVELVL